MSVRVDLQGLTKHWPARAALDGLSLTLEPGKITALLGPSGCGKTTALKIVAGLLAADHGAVFFDGVDQTALPPEQRAAVMVFQSGLLFPRMTVAQNLGFGLRMRGLGAEQTTSRVQAMLAALHLTGLDSARPDQLSGGQAQRVALGRALVLQPKVLLLDEPLASLDPHLRADMQALIRDLQRESGVTTLMVTHDQAEAVAMADSIALMFDGQLRQSGTVRDFLDRPTDAQTARFFGGCNFVAGTVRDRQFHGPFGALPLHHPAPDGPGLLTIRPENLRAGPGPTAQITALRDLGPALRLTFRLQETELTAQWPADQRDWTLGQTLSLHFPPQALWVIPDSR